MLKKIEYLYEDENLKIKNPTKEEREEIRNKSKEYDENTLGDSEELMYYLFKKLIIPTNKDYDFSLYTIDEFIKIIENPHEYKNMETIANTIGMLLQDIIINYLQGSIISIKEQTLKLLSLESTVELENLQRVKRQYEKKAKKNEKKQRL